MICRRYPSALIAAALILVGCEGAVPDKIELETARPAEAMEAGVQEPQEIGAPEPLEPNLAPSHPEIGGISLDWTLQRARQVLQASGREEDVVIDSQRWHTLQYSVDGYGVYVSSEYRSKGDPFASRIGGVTLAAERGPASMRLIKQIYNDYKLLFSQRLGRSSPRVSDLGYVKVYDWEWAFDDYVYKISYQEEPGIRPLDVEVSVSEVIDVSKYLD